MELLLCFGHYWALSPSLEAPTKIVCVLFIQQGKMKCLNGVLRVH